MEFSNVRSQLDELYSRAIETGVSVKQNYPTISETEQSKTIGDLRGTTIALRNIPYLSIYTELEKNNQYHMKLPDGGLLIFQYSFGAKGNLLKHRLAFFPSPTLPSFEEAPDLYQHDELYGDILAERIVRFPVRFDFDPDNYAARFHPHSHLTLGQFENCRIPASHPVSPNTFLLFILRNFYFLLYRRHQNKLYKRIVNCRGDRCITDNEAAIPYFSMQP